MAATLSFISGEYTISGTIGGPPSIYSVILEHAVLHEDFGRGSDGTVLVVSAGRSSFSWPELVVSQLFEPGPEQGFHPGVLLVAETHLLLVGAGTRLLAYDFRTMRRLWEDTADFGFWDWEQCGDVVLMSAELDLAAWNIQGRKMWTTFVEPPWDYSVDGRQLQLDVMGKKSSFDLREGPSAGVAA